LKEKLWGLGAGGEDLRLRIVDCGLRIERGGREGDGYKPEFQLLNAAADGNGDGIVNTLNYDIWAGRVSEPSAMIIFTIGTLLVTARRQ
jgi:hypothetical protein